MVARDTDRVSIGCRRCMVNFDYLQGQRNLNRLLKETINEKRENHRDYGTMHQLVRDE